MTSSRDYKREYQVSQSSTASKKDRASRNKARRQAVKAGRVHKGDGNDIDHKNSNPRDNSPGNLRVQKKGVNRARNQ